MNTKLFISGIIIFAIAGFVFVTSYQGIQEIILKFTTFSPEKYDQYKVMESIGGISAIIGLLVALAGIVEKNQ